MNRYRLLAAVALASVALAAVVSHAALLGIDLGSEFTKTVLVRPGRPPSVVLDETSKRKTPTLVAFGDTERQFGNSATALLTRAPRRCLVWMTRLLGKPFGAVQSLNLRDHYYPYELVETKRGTIAIQMEDGTVYTAEEVVAMLLRNIARQASGDASKIPNSDVVLTVPVHSTVKERQAYADALRIAGLRASAIVEDNTAAAIQVGINRAYNVSEKHRAVFFNMGSTSTSASVVEYSAFKKRGTHVGQVEVIATASDDSLGGEAFDMRLLEHIAAEYSKTPQTANITDVPRAMAKLRVAAKKTKEILSANTEYPVRMESVHNDIDLHVHVSRDEFYGLSQGLFDRIMPVVNQALERASLTPKDLDHFYLVGGTTRIPAIHSILKAGLGRDELDQSLDADEAMAFGSSFVAANNSVSFRVRDFGHVDSSQFPISANLESFVADGETNGWAMSEVIYPLRSKFVKTSVSLENDQDIIVTLAIADSSFLPTSTTPILRQFMISGIPEAHAELSQHGSPSIVVKFAHSAAHYPRVVSAKMTVTAQVVEAASNSTDAEGEKSDKSENITAANATDAAASKVKTKTIKRKLKVEAAGYSEISPMTAEDVQASQEVLQKLDAADKWARDIAAARDDLESYIYSTRSAMRKEDVWEFTLPEIRESLIDALGESEDWLFDDHEDESPNLFQDRLKGHQKISDAIFDRQREAQIRPEAVERARKSFKGIRENLSTLRSEHTWVSADSIDPVQEAFEDAMTWLNQSTAEQSKKPNHEDPVFRAAQLDSKVASLERRVAILFRIPRPPPPPPVKKNTTKSSNETQPATSTSEDESSSAAGADQEAGQEDESQQQQQQTEEDGDAESKPAAESQSPSVEHEAEHTKEQATEQATEEQETGNSESMFDKQEL